MFSTHNKILTQNPVFNTENNNQGNSLSKHTNRNMTPEEIKAYENLIKDSYQMSIFDFDKSTTKE